MIDSIEARKSFRLAYIVFAILYGIDMILAWTFYGLTQAFFKGTGGYQGALIALGSMTVSMAVNCSVVASRVTTATYQPNSRCGFHWTVGFVAWYPVALALCSAALIVVAAIFGIHYEDRTSDSKEVNTDKNVAMGIANVILGCFSFILACVSVYYGQQLQKEMCATKNQGTQEKAQV